jgi:hypothetical protein
MEVLLEAVDRSRFGVGGEGSVNGRMQGFAKWMKGLSKAEISRVGQGSIAPS